MEEKYINDYFKGVVHKNMMVYEKRKNYHNSGKILKYYLDYEDEEEDSDKGEKIMKGTEEEIKEGKG